MSDKNEEQESSNFPRIDFVVPEWVKSLIKWTIIIIVLLISYFVLRWFLGPPGVLIETKHLRGPSKLFYQMINKMKIPRKFVIKN
tara:strand:+ start:316 stop:570 length:255 start_codon:yes stop_codon:yes gene_type:complete